MKKIGLISSVKAFLPENKAYLKFITSMEGYTVKEYSSIEVADLECDLIIFHCGFLPFWKKINKPVIMEYHSLSTTTFPKLKNVIKRVFNKRGVGYIFLNDCVRDGYFFNNLNSSQYIIRGMGYDSQLLTCDCTLEPIYDFIYMGTFKRKGVKEYICKLCDHGFSVIVLGNEENEEFSRKNLTFLGKVCQEKAFQIAKLSKFGLNYTPDVYPLNIQDSTKVIEYCALGLKVVTNRYYWINNFEREIGGKFLDVDVLVNNPTVIDSFDFCNGDVSRYRWDNIIELSGFKHLLDRIFDKSI